MLQDVQTEPQLAEKPLLSFFDAVVESPYYAMGQNAIVFYCGEGQQKHSALNTKDSEDQCCLFARAKTYLSPCEFEDAKQLALAVFVSNMDPVLQHNHDLTTAPRVAHPNPVIQQSHDYMTIKSNRELQDAQHTLHKNWLNTASRQQKLACICDGQLFPNWENTASVLFQHNVTPMMRYAAIDGVKSNNRQRVSSKTVADFELTF